jgi:hypothetical protein
LPGTNPQKQRAQLISEEEKVMADAVSVAPDTYKVIFENDKVR